MAAFWEALTPAAKFFCFLAVPSTAVLLLQTVLTMIGLGGHDADISGAHDALGVDHDLGAHDFGAQDTHLPDTGAHDAHAESGELGDAGFRMFTIKGIVAFFAVFGWTGVGLSGGRLPIALTIFVSLLAGFAAMAVVGLLFYGITRLQSDGTLRLTNTVGLDGRTYIPIPPARTGTGKVQITVQERLAELSAVTDERETIPTGSVVRVIGLEGRNTLLVARVAVAGKIKN